MPNSPWFGVFPALPHLILPTGPCVHPKHPKEMEKPGLGRREGYPSSRLGGTEFIHSHPSEWLCPASSTVGAGMRGSTAWEAPLFPVFLGCVPVPCVGVVGQEEQEGCYSIPTPGSCV